MPLAEVFNFIPLFVLAFFRTAGLMLAAPLFASARIPKRVKLLLALVMAAGLVSGIKTQPRIPDSTLLLALGIGGELVFGLVMGMGVSLTFVAVNWAGEIMGQQMGINLAASFDPQFGQQGSLIGDLYFMLTLIVFLSVRGHHAVIDGLASSFKTLPLLSAGVGPGVLSVFLDLLTSATVLAIKLASPMLVTMLVVDLALGFVGKTMPQINIMTSGLTLRAGLGIAVMIVSLMLSTQVTRQALYEGIETVNQLWKGTP